MRKNAAPSAIRPTTARPVPTPIPILAPLDRPPPPSEEVAALGEADAVDEVWPGCNVPVKMDDVVEEEDDDDDVELDTCSTPVGTDAVTSMCVDVGV